MTNEEIDKRIAEEVMGFNVDKNSIVLPWNDQRKAAEHKLGLSLPDGDIVHYWIPPYSTDMNAAMEVANKIIERKPACFSIEWTPDGEHRWFAVFILDGDKTSSWACGGADTPAMAICLAALEAVKK